jgi:hypothetical protein
MASEQVKKSKAKRKLMDETGTAKVSRYAAEKKSDVWLVVTGNNTGCQV